MTRTTQFLRISIVTALVVAVAQAHAWGPRAQRTITGMAIQVIQGKFPGTFRPGDTLGRFAPGQTSYERDVLLGAEKGWEVISKDIPITSDKEAILAVAAQIHLLAEVRPYGAGSYFAYRLGALSALISDIMLPYGLAWTPEHQELKTQIEADIEQHLRNYGYTNHSTKRTLMINVPEYFGAQQHFYKDNMMLIADDYKRGRGYNGLLKESSQAHFESAIEAVSDAWFTIMEGGESPSSVSANDDLIAKYFVDEIAYQLEEKRNLHQAGVVYENLASLNSTDPGIYEAVGDLFYAFDTKQSAERSVREWRIAYDLSGANREAVAMKISNHFLREGRDYLEQAGEVGKGETELPAALAAFKQALQYNRTSEAAADLIQDTNKRITERNERREMVIDIIAKAERAREESDNLVTGGDFGNAIQYYRQADEILNAVGDEFTDQYEIATTLKQDLVKSVSSAVSKVQDLASAAIDEGERLEEQNKYDEAEKAYARVPTLVSVIPDDINPTITEHKNETIALANKKIEEAQNNKKRYEANLQNQPGGAAGAAGVPRPGGAAAGVPRPGGAAAPAAPAAAPAGNAGGGNDRASRYGDE
jgi:tetratricopeptide (TPR) repeat protein